MKLKALALAAVLAASGAHAAIDLGNTSGDGSLMATIAWGTTATGGSATFDLGVTFSEVASWQSAINAANGNWFRSWNLSTGVMSGTGIGNAVIANYGTAFNQFNTAAGTNSTAQLAVFAFDGIGSGVGSRGLYTTANGVISATGAVGANPATPSNTIGNGLSNEINVVNWMTAVNLAGSHATDGNGANYATSGNSAFFYSAANMEKLGNTGMFDVSGAYQGSYAAGTTTLAGMDTALPFYLMTSTSTTPTVKQSLTALGYDGNTTPGLQGDANGALPMGGTEYAVWTLQGDVLTVSAVPEPESYAMLLAGLGLMGAIARRRKQA